MATDSPSRSAVTATRRSATIPESERTLSMANIRWFAPTGEPDREL